MKLIKTLLLLVIILFFGFSFLKHNSAFAQSEEDRLSSLNRQIEEYQKQIQNLQTQANTLTNQIAQFDAQIKLTELKIDQTQGEILLLTGRIDELEVSLSSLAEAFKSRVVETYKMSRLGEPIVIILTSSDLTQAVSRYDYMKRIQEADRMLLVRLQSTQNTYKVQKESMETLKTKLDGQKQDLDGQKKAKANLLSVTRSDEKKYQELLSATRAELEAIQAIIAGRGDETKAGSVNQGERIASIISGASCNSSGGHLHFIVSEDGNTKNPFSYLKSGIDFENCSGSSCGSSNGDPFNPSGPWDWPISPKVRYSQGYGSTWATRNTWVGKIYNFHNGIDIDSETSGEVRAVQKGDLYRGSYTGYQGCRLRYVRVDHADSNLDTFYLHVNY